MELTYSRALELCDSKDAPEERFKALWGLWFVQFMRGNVPGMQAVADRLSPLAEDIASRFIEYSRSQPRSVWLSRVRDWASRHRP